MSKRLVTLDQHVDLDVPVEDLAVHEPDYRNLIAFLKAMEFTTLTRRVAEQSGIDASADRAEREAGFARGGNRGPPTTAPAAAKQPKRAGRQRCPPARRRLPPVRRGKGRPRRRRDKSVLTPISLARSARCEELRGDPFDRSKYEMRPHARRGCKAWIARAIRHRHVAIDTETNSLDPMQATCAASRWRSAPNEACYVPLGHRDRRTRRRRRPVRAPSTLRRPDPGRDALAAIKPLLEDPACSRSART